MLFAERTFVDKDGVLVVQVSALDSLSTRPKHLTLSGKREPSQLRKARGLQDHGDRTGHRRHPRSAFTLIGLWGMGISL